MADDAILRRFGRSKQHGRPMSFNFSSFFKQAYYGELKRATYTVKADGFRIIVKIEDGRVAYFTNSGRRTTITDTPSNILEAIVLFLRTEYPELTPENVKWDGKRPVKEIHLEFVAYKDGKQYLKGLYLKECLDPKTGLLDNIHFSYGVVLFDCRVNEEGEMDPIYIDRWTTLEDSVRDLYGPRKGGALMCDMVCGKDDLFEFLMEEEGIVFHQLLPGRVEPCYKLKMPKIVFSSRIIAVANTIEDFNGFNLILVGVPRNDGSWSVIHLFDWTEMFQDYNRIKQGKAFVNKGSVKIGPGGVVTCTSTSSMQPLMDAVFRAISSVERFPPIAIGSTTAVARFKDVKSGVEYRCNSNRSFSFTMKGAKFQFLSAPVNVVLGCGQLWELKNSELHLQPAWILRIGDFGHEAYAEIIDSATPYDLLLRMARDETLTPPDFYRMVGMKTGPFLGWDELLRDRMRDSYFSIE